MHRLQETVASASLLKGARQARSRSLPPCAGDRKRGHFLPPPRLPLQLDQHNSVCDLSLHPAVTASLASFQRTSRELSAYALLAHGRVAPSALPLCLLVGFVLRNGDAAGHPPPGAPAPAGGAKHLAHVIQHVAGQRGHVDSRRGRGAAAAPLRPASRGGPAAGIRSAGGVVR